MARRGYTLLELAVASAMAGILTVAGLSAFASFNRHRVRMERATTADDTAKVVLQYLIRETQRIGGSSLRPWQAIAVEQDPCPSTTGSGVRDLNCPAGDRVTYAFADDKAVFSACVIAGLTDTTITFESVGHATLTGCCNQFRFDANDNPVVVPATQLANTHLMLSSTGFGGVSRERYRAVTYTNSVGDSDTCTFPILTSGQVRPLTSQCTVDGVIETAETCADGRPTNSVFFSGAIIERRANAIPITVATAYVGCTTPSCATNPEDLGLFIFSDRNAGVTATTTVDDTDDNFAVSPNIIDLQVALGYDRDDDGEIEESVTGAGDDFSGNRSPTTPGVPIADVAAPPGETIEDPRQLRMMAIGVVAAIKVNDGAYRSEAQLPGGEPLVGQGLHLRALMSKAAFRSLNLLE
jgi:prepilin-type N-terminal cleavage/methylation domain-containing protein